ncbi:hypothetical protein OHA79_39770 [Streptomyces sp. NBC_00841]|uniref:hypothetical protein n=1 Tax=Streptomyces sp. NBC_00841 TaxID=2975847 RepID=UPI002DD958BF|nr:hypothetical protein [Streptomyces sp. NBC_00841]WSA03423.1 hypothetical protein OHA79_39770 [Streptomyces sp. NBC_00841]
MERDVRDYYRICDGTVGLPVLAGYEDDPRLIIDRARWDGTPEPGLPGICAGGPRGLIDFRDALRAKAAEHEFSLLSSRNVLTLGGSWYELEEAPLHGACQGRAECIHEPDVGNEHLGVQSCLLALPGDTLLVNVRCHV